MSKRTTRNTANNTNKSGITAATIKEQTAAFLKSGGSIQYVVKGTSGQPAGGLSQFGNRRAK